MRWFRLNPHGFLEASVLEGMDSESQHRGVEFFASFLFLSTNKVRKWASSLPLIVESINGHISAKVIVKHKAGVVWDVDK